MNPTTRQDLGFGLGLRKEHYEEILTNRPEVDWFEVLSENYMVPGGKPLFYLDQIREHYPVVMHGVSLSIGSSDEIDQNYLIDLKKLARRINPFWFSDHLCWTGVGGRNLHDLMPLPYSDEAIRHVVKRIQQVQDFMELPMLIENVSSYITYTCSQMSEWEFLNTIATEADCYILLDVNNIYVSSFNHEFDPDDYLQGIDSDRVWQIHLAGHINNGSHIIDTHDHPVIEPVWELYANAVRQFGSVSTMIERDDNIPALDELLLELERCRHISQQNLR